MQMNRFVQLHNKFSCAFFWRLNYIKLSVAVLFFVSGKYNYKLRGTERGNVQLHEFKFNRIIFFDGCKMDISLSAPNHHHKLIIIVSIDLQFDVAFFINTGLRLSVLLSLSLLLFLVCFWLKQSLESCAIKIEMVFQCLKMNVVASLALHTYAHTNSSTAKCCKCSHPSWIIKSFGYLFHFYVRFHTHSLPLEDASKYRRFHSHAHSSFFSLRFFSSEFSIWTRNSEIRLIYWRYYDQLIWICSKWTNTYGY